MASFISPFFHSFVFLPLKIQNWLIFFCYMLKDFWHWMTDTIFASVFSKVFSSCFFCFLEPDSHHYYYFFFIDNHAYFFSRIWYRNQIFIIDIVHRSTVYHSWKIFCSPCEIRTDFISIFIDTEVKILYTHNKIFRIQKQTNSNSTMITIKWTEQST